MDSCGGILSSSSPWLRTSSTSWGERVIERCRPFPADVWPPGRLPKGSGGGRAQFRRALGLAEVGGGNARSALGLRSW